MIENDYITVATGWALTANRVRLQPDQAGRIAALWEAALIALEAARREAGVTAEALFDVAPGQFSQLIGAAR
jgi:hypothetical protein